MRDYESGITQSTHRSMYSRVPTPPAKLIAPTSAVHPVTLGSAARRQSGRLPKQAVRSAEVATEGEVDKSRIHEIPKSRWPDGVPPVMGGHLMGSGEVHCPHPTDCRLWSRSHLLWSTLRRLCLALRV